MTTTIESTAAATTTRLTYDDYCQLPDDGKRYEIIDGELYVNPAPVPLHQIIIRQFLRVLQDWLDAHDGGDAIGSPIDVVLDRWSVVQPDVIVVLPGSVAIIGKKNIKGAPDLVIEVLSASTRKFDENAKRKLYARVGVREYWTVDADGGEVKVYRRAETVVLKRGDVITCELLPGLEIPLHQILPE